jgi:hypothetical protein
MVTSDSTSLTYQAPWVQRSTITVSTSYPLDAYCDYIPPAHHYLDELSTAIEQYDRW